MRLDHAIFLTRELIARLADLQIWVVAQPSFLWDMGQPLARGPVEQKAPAPLAWQVVLTQPQPGSPEATRQ